MLVLGSSTALALTSLRIDGLITFLDMSVDRNDAGIEENDPFAIEMTFDEALIMALGTETLILGTDAASTFGLTIRDADTANALFQQSAADDLFGGPLLTLENGTFDSLVFQSTDSNDLGPEAFAQVDAANAGVPFPPSGGLEILGSNDSRQLVLGAFSKISVSPD